MKFVPMVDRLPTFLFSLLFSFPPGVAGYFKFLLSPGFTDFRLCYPPPLLLALFLLGFPTPLCSTSRAAKLPLTALMLAPQSGLGNWKSCRLVRSAFAFLSSLLLFVVFHLDFLECGFSFLLT